MDENKVAKKWTEHTKVNTPNEQEIKYHPVDRIPVFIKAREAAQLIGTITKNLPNKYRQLIGLRLIDAVVMLELSIMRTYQENSSQTKRIEYAHDILDKSKEVLLLLRIVYDNGVVARTDYIRELANIVAIENQTKNWIEKMAANLQQ